MKKLTELTAVIRKETTGGFLTCIVLLDNKGKEVFKSTSAHPQGSFFTSYSLDEGHMQKITLFAPTMQEGNDVYIRFNSLKEI